MATITSYKKKAKDCIAPDDAHHSGRTPRLPFGHDAKKEAQVSDYRDKLTFDEVILNDEEMAKYAVKNSEPKEFRLEEMAKMYRRVCVKMTLERCGVTYIKGMPPDRYQKKMDAAKIVVENREKDPWGRPFYKGENAWRNGVYVFKNGELVAFISIPQEEIPSQFAINRKKRWIVHTNAKAHTKGFR